MQSKEILAHLQMGNKLTPLDALEKFGCFRLAARVHELRQAGHPIHRELVYDGGTSYARYYMEKEE